MVLDSVYIEIKLKIFQCILIHNMNFISESISEFKPMVTLTKSESGYCFGHCLKQELECVRWTLLSFISTRKDRDYVVTIVKYDFEKLLFLKKSTTLLWLTNFWQSLGPKLWNVLWFLVSYLKTTIMILISWFYEIHVFDPTKYFEGRSATGLMLVR